MYTTVLLSHISHCCFSGLYHSTGQAFGCWRTRTSNRPHQWELCQAGWSFVHCRQKGIAPSLTGLQTVTKWLYFVTIFSASVTHFCKWSHLRDHSQTQLLSADISVAYEKRQTKVKLNRATYELRSAQRLSARTATQSILSKLRTALFGSWISWH